MALTRRSHAAYADLFGHITHDDAEKDADPLFGATPKMTISTQIEVDGLLLTVTIEHTSIDEAVRLLKRRGARSTVPQAKPARRRRRHPSKPTFDLIWSDFDDDTPAPAHGTRVIELAQALRNEHPSWSAALAVAAKTVKENLQ